MVEELRFLCWAIAMFFWIRAFLLLMSVRTYVGSQSSTHRILYYQAACQSYWSFLRGNLLMLPFDILDLKHDPASFWEPAFLTLVSIVLILRWRSDRRNGLQLMAAGESIPDQPNA